VRTRNRKRDSVAGHVATLLPRAPPHTVA
jgi:hypothetical protein